MKALIRTTIFAIALYLGCSFFAVSFDITTWSEGNRLIASVSFITFAFFAILFVDDTVINKFFD